MKDTILQVGDPLLRAHAKPVAKKDIGSKKIKAVIAAMRRALDPQENGVAIAAPQIGEPLRIFIVAAKVFEEEEPKSSEEISAPIDKVFINPELLRQSRQKSAMSEGCLSVHGVFGTVRRHEKATVRALDEHGSAFTLNGSGLLAQIFQHEVDHLNGVLFIDKTEHLDEPATKK